MRRRAIIGALGSGALAGCLRFRESVSEEPNEFNQTSDNPAERRSDDSDNTGSKSNEMYDWEFKAEAPLTSPVLGDNHVYVGSADQSLSALDRSTGETVWSIEGDEVFSPPTIIGGEVYTYAGGSLLRIGPDDGEILGELRATSAYLIADDIILTDHTLLGSSEPSGFVAFDRSDGTRRWQSELGGMNGLAIGEDVFVFGSTDDTTKETRVHTLDRQTGEALWSLSRDELTDERVKLAFATHNGIIAMVADTGTVYGVDAVDGTVLWETETSHQRDPNHGGNDFPTPVEFSGEFVICSLEIQAMNAETGELTWTAGSGLPEIRTAPPTYKNNALDRLKIDGILYYPAGVGEYNRIIGVTSSGEIAVDVDVPKAFEKLPVVDDTQRYYVSHPDATLRTYEQL
jgi:outer membrane protein assembly factor BamB